MTTLSPPAAAQQGNRSPAPVGAGRPDGSAKGGPADDFDPWLATLEWYCDHFAKPFSAAPARHGLPLVEGKLTATTFVRAANNHALRCKAVARKPSRVPTILCPYAVAMRSGDVAIVVGRSRSGSLHVVVPRLGSGYSVAKPATFDREATGTVFYVTDNEAMTRRGLAGSYLSDLPTGHWLWRPLGNHWGSWVHFLFAALFINVLALALPLFVMNVYDRVIPNNSIPTLWALAAGVGIAIMFDFVLRMLRAMVLDHAGRRIDMSASARLFEQALDATMAARPARSGELASHIREFEGVREFFASSGITSLVDLLFIGVFLFVLWLIVGPLAVIPLIAIPAVLAVTLIAQIPLSRAVASAQATSANRQSVLVEALVSIETVKAVSAEGVMQAKWEDAVAGSVRAGSATRFWSSFAMYFSLFAQQCVSVGIIVWGVFLVAAGEITIGALIAANILSGRVLAPLTGIAMTLARAQQSLTALGQLNRLMSLERDHPPIRAGEAKGGGEPSTAKIEIRNVSFTYPGLATPAISGLTVTIGEGEKVGVIGRVGSGKSTLGKLLCGLYPIRDGSVLAGGIDIRQMPVAQLREMIAYCGQEPELFSGTLADNIRLSSLASPEAFEQAVAVSGVAEIAAHLPLGMATPLGERGRGLSGGQRQAVALARMMLMDRARVLFLDEPTSAMDNASEAAFIRGFRRWLPKDRTLMLSTHRSSMLELVDRLIVLEGGRIIADGPRDSVLQSLARSAAKPGSKSPVMARLTKSPPRGAAGKSDGE